MKKEILKDIKFDEKKGVYYFRKQVGGKRIYKQFTSKNKAYDFLSKFIKETQKKVDDGILLSKENMLIKQLFDEYISTKLCKEETLDKLKRNFKNYFNNIENSKLSAINVTFLRKWLKTIPEYLETKKISYVDNSVTYKKNRASLRWQCTCLMRQMLKFAVENRYMQPISSYWCEGIHRVARDSENINNKTMSYENTIKLIEFLDNYKNENAVTYREDGWTPDRVSFTCKVLIYTGVRFGELRALKVNDFNRGMFCKKECYVCTVSKQLNDKNKLTSLKNAYSFNGESRVVPLTSEVYAEFEDFFKKNNYDDDQFILDFNKTNSVPRRNSFPRVLNKYIAEAKKQNILPETVSEDLSNHSFRRTNTKYLYKVLNLPFEMAAKIQGHTVDVMLKNYIAIDNEEKNLSVFDI